MAAPTFSSCHSLTFSVQLKIGQTSRRLVRPKMTELILGTGNSETFFRRISKNRKVPLAPNNVKETLIQ